MSFLEVFKAWWMKMLSPVTVRLDYLEDDISELGNKLELTEQLLEQQVIRIRESLGRIENRHFESSTTGALTDHEYRVFSQWGEDGILQHLLRCVNIDNKIFVEFGVSDYSEANTRFLLVNNNWSGLVLDSSQANIDKVRRSSVSWQYNLKAAQAFVTRDNINQLIAAGGINGEIGLMSIDIDGNDYWVWQAIDVVNPVIVVIEYNHRFGSELAVTIPYDENFRRGEKYPVIYFGASLAALCLLAKRRGYAFVGCNSNGVNAFFVRRDRLSDSLTELTVAEGYVPGKFTENRDEQGYFIPASPEQEKLQLLSLPLVDVTKAE